MEQSSLNNIKLYCIENSAYISKEGMQWREKVFNFWHPQWTKIYIDLGSEKTPSYSDFNQYHIFNCVAQNGEIIGMTAHKFINLEEPLIDKIEFVQSLGTSFIDQLNQLGVKKVMTFESLLINPAFRKSHTPQRLSKMMVYFGNFLFSPGSADAIIAAARRDLKASQLSLELGYKVLESDKKFRVFPCDLNIQLNRDLFLPGDEAYHLSKEIWANREVFTNQSYWGTSLEPQINKKQAA